MQAVIDGAGAGEELVGARRLLLVVQVQAEEEQPRRVGVTSNDVLRAVAVVHVQVDDGHALAVVCALQRVQRTGRHVVEYAEAAAVAAV